MYTLEDVLRDAKAADKRYADKQRKRYPSHTPVLMERTQTQQLKDAYGNVTLDWYCPMCLRTRRLRVVKTQREDHPPLCTGRISHLFDGHDPTHAKMIVIYQQDRERRKWLLESMPPVPSGTDAT